jgi:hypothetical protein
LRMSDVGIGSPNVQIEVRSGKSDYREKCRSLALFLTGYRRTAVTQLRTERTALVGPTSFPLEGVVRPRGVEPLCRMRNSVSWLPRYQYGGRGQNTAKDRHFLCAATLEPQLSPQHDGCWAHQNTCLFSENNDLSASVDRTAYDECMAGRGYVLRDNCPSTATKRSCYDHKP